jgi:Ca2+-binding EF-hand superfamily protein
MILFFLRIDQREFLIGFALTSTGSVREKLKYVFRTYDQDKDGFISKKEIDRMVKVSHINRFFSIIIILMIDCNETSCKR